MKKLLIYQSYYIPWRGYFDMINMADEFIIYDDMQFCRRGFYSRNQLKTPNGRLWLTIPVNSKNHQQNGLAIKNTKIADPKWGEKHWKSIVANYSKAKYFKEYKETFENLYLSKEYESLSEVNINFIKTICEILNINTKISYSWEYELIGDKNERLINLIKQSNSQIYVSSPVAQDYMDIDMFKHENISIEWMDYSGYKDYTQLFGDFEPRVSIIDLIFNEGPNSTNYMKSFN